MIQQLSINPKSQITNNSLLNKNQKTSKDTSFSGLGSVLTASLQACEQHPMIGVSVIDAATCIVPRAAVDFNTNAHAGLETVTQPFSIKMGEDHEMPLAGAVTLGSFVGGVFNDTNANGLCDAGESMLGGAVLTAVSASGSEITAEADENGAFALTGLRPDEYTLTITLPDGYIFSHDLARDDIALPAAVQQTFDCPWQVLISRSEKAVGAVRPAAISGVIWMDENKNGTREDSEWIMQDLPLSLIDEATGLEAASAVSGRGAFTSFYALFCFIQSVSIALNFCRVLSHLRCCHSHLIRNR